jgi:DNA-binding XRE family transcriptional regulator
MALRRQGLAQRRKAVGLTQEALAQRLGVERSTVVRWEAGDTEPLPSIRPHVAHALQLSLDQLAELLTEEGNAGTTRALPVGTDVTLPVLLPAVLPRRDQCGDLVPPEVTKAFEALRGALRSAGVSPEDVDAMVSTGRSSHDTAGEDVAAGTLVPARIEVGELARSDVSEPAAPTEVLRRPFLTAISLDVGPGDIQRRRATSRRFKRFAAAGTLAVIFAGGAASVPFMASRSAPIPPTGAGNPLSPPPAAPHAGSGNRDVLAEGPAGAIHPAPADTLGTATGDPAPPAAAAVPAPHTIRASNPKRTTSRPKSPASAATPPAPRTAAIPAEAYAAWSEMAARASDHHRTRIRPEARPHP